MILLIKLIELNLKLISYAYRTFSIMLIGIWERNGNAALQK